MRKNRSEGRLFFVLGMLTKLVSVSILLVTLAGSAVAYTLVFRGGRRAEIPEEFTVTTTTLTYEAAPGINQTVQLAMIDVAATERLNNEAPGSFFKHIASEVIMSPSQSVGRARRTLTNLDLEPARQRRIASEREYERRRVELGLPSIEESLRRQAQDEASTLELARRHAAAGATEEAYWRGWAASLRNEILNVDAQINYLSARLGEVQSSSLNQGYVGGGVVLVPSGVRNRNRYPQPDAGRMGRIGSPETGPRGDRRGTLGRSSRPTGGYGYPNGGYGYPNGGYGYPNGGYGYPTGGYGYPQIGVTPYGSAEKSYDVGVKLDDLQQRRAGLEAQWRELENQARIAKVPAAWLLP